MTETDNSWHATNQRLLAAEVARVRALLESRARMEPEPSREARGMAEMAMPSGQAQRPGPKGHGDGADEPASARALAAICRSFELSPFERDVLVMCAGMELDGKLAATCAAAHGDPARGYPTFGLALAALPGAHWSALTPRAPLRSWRLVELDPGGMLTTAWLRIDEAVLHFLAGVFCLDERLVGLVEHVPPPDELPPSQQAVAARLAGLWSDETGPPPVVHVGGRDASGRRAVVAAASASCGLALCALRAADVPAAASEREALARLWERQALLGRSALLVGSDDGDGAEATRLAAALAARVGSPTALAGREPPQFASALVRLDVPMPTATEQEELWRRAVASADLDGAVERGASQFDLGAEAIRAAGAEARAREAAGAPVGEALWDAGRAQARPGLDDLAQRIEPAAGWDDLVLPERERRTIRELFLHVRHRALVHERWGFAAKSSRGLGVSALFVGPSGTGKTMAAEVLAGELRLDLYRIDLSAVVSKYIGETEKNLRRVFDAAEQGGAILLFDEADALFGKRSEVKDSHDRYANIEVGYLLQRMEVYRGLAILTTNLKSALDPAFLRRLRFVVQFPRPDAEARRAIWRRIFPERTPVDRLDADALARLDVTGGAICNIALRAAFLAADAAAPVGMAHLAEAARSECAKLERPIAESEIGAWA
ncbi:MAG: ATP-binding protein [Gaiellaceae bacterium]